MPLTPRKRAGLFLSCVWSVYAMRSIYTIAAFLIEKADSGAAFRLADKWLVFVLVPAAAIALSLAFYRGARWPVVPLLVCGLTYFFYLGGMLSLIVLLSLSPSWTTVMYVFMTLAHGYLIWVAAREWWRRA